MSALGHKQTFTAQSRCPLYPQKRTLIADWNVRFVPIADIVRALFDHLIRASEYGRRHREAERLSGPEVDNQLELSRLFDGQIGALFALSRCPSTAARLKHI